MCPVCGGKLKVVDTRHIKKDNSTVRRRRCMHCGFLFYTQEKEVDYASIRNEWLKVMRAARYLK